MKRAPSLAALALISGCASAPLTSSLPSRMFVAAPVADVRARQTLHIGRYVQDPDQETQVLQGEPVIVKERRSGWVRVECPRQPEYTHNNVWEGYPGWIEESLLTADAAKEIQISPDARPTPALRLAVLAQARLHLGEAYLWGGRSLHSDGDRKTVTGVDCSGLVNWSFLQIGIIVPRDAHEQFMRAHRVESNALMPGDLVFSARADRPDRVTHVAFYAGEGRIIEAPQSGQPVHEITAEERFGRKLSDISNGETVGERVIYFGTLFEAK